MLITKSFTSAYSIINLTSPVRLSIWINTFSTLNRKFLISPRINSNISHGINYCRSINSQNITSLQIQNEIFHNLRLNSSPFHDSGSSNRKKGINNNSKIQKMSQVYPELVCLGNPLLDCQVDSTAEFLNKYQLKSNDAILVEDSSKDPRMAIFDELLENPKTLYIAGGAAQNTSRGSAYVLGQGKVGYFGCVGNDAFSKQLLKENESAGVISLYQIDSEHGTGKCAAMITGLDRSMVTDLGAANHFKPEHLDKHWDVVEHAKAFYIGGFHLTVSPEAIIKLGKHAQSTGKPFVLNFSAPFIPQFFKSQLESVLPYATHIIANESEAESFAESFKLDVSSTKNLKETAEKIVESYKTTVIFTHGLEPTVVATADGAKITEIPVHPLDVSKIKDTNGAGDAFAGGFMAGIILGDSLEKCIDRGQWLAKLSIQEVGAAYPTEKLTYQ